MGGSPGGPVGQAPAMPGVIWPSFPVSTDVPIGADGTAYLLRAQLTITFPGRNVQYNTEVLAVGLDKNVPTKWKVTLAGIAQRAAVGQEQLYVAVTQPQILPILTTMPQPTTAGPEFQLLFLSAANGSTAKTVTIKGSLAGLQVRQVGGVEYIYVTVVRAGAGQDSGLGLVILNAAGSQVKALDADTDALQEQ